MPELYRAQHYRNNYKHPPRYTPVQIRGDLGVIPADNIALLAPVDTPNIVYTAHTGRTGTIKYTTRQTLTNSEHQMQGQ